MSILERGYEEQNTKTLKYLVSNILGCQVPVHYSAKYLQHSDIIKHRNRDRVEMT